MAAWLSGFHDEKKDQQKATARNPARLTAMVATAAHVKSAGAVEAEEEIRHERRTMQRGLKQKYSMAIRSAKDKLHSMMLEYKAHWRRATNAARRKWLEAKKMRRKWQKISKRVQAKAEQQGEAIATKKASEKEHIDMQRLQQQLQLQYEAKIKKIRDRYSSKSTAAQRRYKRIKAQWHSQTTAANANVKQLQQLYERQMGLLHQKFEVQKNKLRHQYSSHLDKRYARRYDAKYDAIHRKFDLIQSKWSTDVKQAHEQYSAQQQEAQAHLREKVTTQLETLLRQFRTYKAKLEGRYRRHIGKYNRILLLLHSSNLGEKEEAGLKGRLAKWRPKVEHSHAQLVAAGEALQMALHSAAMRGVAAARAMVRNEELLSRRAKKQWRAWKEQTDKLDTQEMSRLKLQEQTELTDLQASFTAKRRTLTSQLKQSGQAFKTQASQYAALRARLLHGVKAKQQRYAEEWVAMKKAFVAKQKEKWQDKYIKFTETTIPKLTAQITRDLRNSAKKAAKHQQSPVEKILIKREARYREKLQHLHSKYNDLKKSYKALKHHDRKDNVLFADKQQTRKDKSNKDRKKKLPSVLAKAQRHAVQRVDQASEAQSQVMGAARKTHSAVRGVLQTMERKAQIQAELAGEKAERDASPQLDEEHLNMAQARPPEGDEKGRGVVKPDGIKDDPEMNEQLSIAQQIRNLKTSLGMDDRLQQDAHKEDSAALVGVAISSPVERSPAPPSSQSIAKEERKLRQADPKADPFRYITNQVRKLKQRLGLKGSLAKDARHIEQASPTETLEVADSDLADSDPKLVGVAPSSGSRRSDFRMADGVLNRFAPQKHLLDPQLAKEKQQAHQLYMALRRKYGISDSLTRSDTARGEAQTATDDLHLPVATMSTAEIASSAEGVLKALTHSMNSQDAQESAAEDPTYTMPA